MKQLFKFLIIFIVGAVTYAVLNPLLSSYLKNEPSPEEPIVSTSTPIVVTKVTPVVEEPEVEESVQIDQAGGVHDGPFPLYTQAGTKVAGSVQIIRSPEETLLQFEETTLVHSKDAVIYFATDKSASKFFNIGKAQLTEDVLIYGLPIDATVGTYKYILIYNKATKQTEFYAEIK